MEATYTYISTHAVYYIYTDEASVSSMACFSCIFSDPMCWRVCTRAKKYCVQNCGVSFESVGIPARGCSMVQYYILYAIKTFMSVQGHAALGPRREVRLGQLGSCARPQLLRKGFYILGLYWYNLHIILIINYRLYMLNIITFVGSSAALLWG